VNTDSISGTPFARRNIAQQLADELERAFSQLRLSRCRLPSVRELAVEYGVSPNTANAALRLLADRQLIQVLPRKGAFINRPICSACLG
jgi:DNA-binding GntR family transcriptional regulator